MFRRGWESPLPLILHWQTLALARSGSWRGGENCDTLSFSVVLCLSSCHRRHSPSLPAPMKTVVRSGTAEELGRTSRGAESPEDGRQYGARGAEAELACARRTFVLRIT